MFNNNRLWCQIIHLIVIYNENVSVLCYVIDTWAELVAKVACATL